MCCGLCSVKTNQGSTANSSSISIFINNYRLLWSTICQQLPVNGRQPIVVPHRIVSTITVCCGLWSTTCHQLTVDGRQPILVTYRFVSTITVCCGLWSTICQQLPVDGRQPILVPHRIVSTITVCCGLWTVSGWQDYCFSIQSQCF